MTHCKIFASLALIVPALLGCGAAQNDGFAPAVAAADTPRTLAQITSSSASSAEIIPGKLADYTIVKTADGYTVTNKTGTEPVRTISNVKKLQFADVSVSLESDGTAAQAYRLYQAAFDRTPDLGGLGFHVTAIDGTGASLAQVAQGFINSPEFSQKYGSVDNQRFVTLLYSNVLHRVPDSGGLSFWTGFLDSGALSRAQVLTGFSESPENKTQVAARIENGVVYIPSTVSGTGSATTLTPEGAKVAWGVTNKLTISLTDARGIEIPGGHMSCFVAGQPIMAISPDCRTAIGQRLGEQVVTVKGDGVTASLRLKVIPQRQPIATGVSNFFNMLVTGNGNVLAWGQTMNGVLGQGVGSSDLAASLPVMVKNTAGTGALTQVVSASAGEANGMALTEDGDVMMWGLGGATILELSTTNRYLPIRVPNPAGTGSLSHVVQVAVGKDHAAVLNDDGTVVIWGRYTGTETYKTYPDYVKDGSGSGVLAGIVSISAGGNFTLALGANGKVYGWGSNGTGQTGRGTKSYLEMLPAAVKLASDDSELSDIVAISAGNAFALALAADGKVYAWGDNSDGQLGQNIKQYGGFPRAVLVKDSGGSGILTDIAMVRAGGSHALALDTSGRVLSWGSTAVGVLGDGANRPRSTFGSVSPLKPWAVVGPASTGQLGKIVSIGIAYTNSLALSDDGTVYIWGDGYGGLLGQGGTSNLWSAVPIPVKNLSGSGPLNLSPLTVYPNLLQRGL
jgi:alpha-tubulin suppressor-like RCC1 family protein